MFDALPAPWKHHVMAILSEDLGFCLGRIVDVNHHTVTCDSLVLHPQLGLQLNEPRLPVTLEVPSPLSLKVGDTIGFRATKISENRYQLNSHDQIWGVAMDTQNDKWTVINLFAGFFDGWSRAFKWIKSRCILDVNRFICIDNDSAIQQFWKMSNMSLYEAAIPVSCGDTNNVGITCGVGQFTWFNVLGKDDNYIMTMSPPCQPWSAGGLQSGLGCPNGFAFLEAIQVAKQLQPMLLLAECSDRIVSHPNFKIIKLAFQLAGFRCVWSSVCNLGEIVDMSRKRWLAVYIRKDLSSLPISGQFKLGDGIKTPWSDPSFSFPVPQVLRDQLFLSPELVEVYSDSKLLPRGMANNLTGEGSKEEVLNARLLSADVTMPTLCASYSQQHNLAEHHIKDRGLYTSLTVIEGTWSFLDPLCFVGLMGTPGNQSITLPVNISDAFHGLGNCIAVPHALLCIMV